MTSRLHAPYQPRLVLLTAACPMASTLRTSFSPGYIDDLPRAGLVSMQEAASVFVSPDRQTVILRWRHGALHSRPPGSVYFAR